MTIEELRALAAHYASDPVIRLSQKAFSDGSALDPLTLYSVRTYPDAKDLFVLKDWWNEAGDTNTVEENVAYCRRVAAATPFDPSLSRLFRADWSRERFETGTYAAMNFIWGLKDSESPTGPVEEEVLHRSFSLLFMPIIKAVNPETVYFCGRWAEKYYRILRQSLGQGAIWHCHPGHRQNGWINQLRYD